MKNQTFNFVVAALAIVSTGNVAKAEHFRLNSDFSHIGVEACENAPNYERLECAQIIRGAWFDPKLSGFCASKVPKFEVKDCLKATANKRYDSYSVRICERENRFERVDCLRTFGTPYRETTASEIILDAIDQAIVDLIKEAYRDSASNASEVCEVQNSTAELWVKFHVKISETQPVNLPAVKTLVLYQT